MYDITDVRRISAAPVGFYISQSGWAESWQGCFGQEEKCAPTDRRGLLIAI